MAIDLQAQLDFGLRHIRTAANIAVAAMQQGGEIVGKASGPQGPIDRAVRDYLRGQVLQQSRGKRAANVYVGEEAKESREAWVVDEFDGSWLAVRNVKVGAISMAFTVDGQPKVGVVLNPFTGETMWAIEGGPTYLNGAQVRVTNHARIRDGYFGIPGCLVDAFDTLGVASEILHGGGDTYNWGSVVCDAMLVVQGAAEAMVYPYTSPWDMAAIEVLIKGAGGHFTGLHGGKSSYGGSIDGGLVTNGVMHDPMRAMLVRNGLK